MRRLLASSTIAMLALAACRSAQPSPPQPAATTGATTADAQEDFRWRGRLAAGQQIEVKGVNGRITAAPTDGDVVDVRATKRAKKSDPASVRIDVVEHAGGVTICAVYPTPRGRRPNECAPGSGGRNNVRRNDVKVDFVVEVPADIDLAARTVNGGIDVGELAGAVAAKTVNGSIRIDAARRAAAETVNGSIVARITDARWRDDLDFETVNGGITLELPQELDADLRIRTVNGRIDSDFPMRVQGRISRRRLQGTIGGGGPELSLRTVNGSIRLRRLPATGV